jgi:N-carbamoylputrescine amidase
MEMAWDNVLGGCPLVQRMQVLARTYGVVLPVSLFERENNMLYNTVVMVDGDGTLLGKYRKSHIPDANGYQEKYYFSPGDTGFQVWDTMVGKVGVGICWDQWFPEAARAMALQGADVLLYPTAIGTEPNDPTVDSSDHWQRVMQGHAAANVSLYG